MTTDNLFASFQKTLSIFHKNKFDTIINNNNNFRTKMK